MGIRTPDLLHAMERRPVHDGPRQFTGDPFEQVIRSDRITSVHQSSLRTAAGSLNQVPVEVTITTGSMSDVLIVPVDALLSQPGGGYAVEVTGPGGHHLVSITPGLFDDAAGTVQVTGNLRPGQHVVVPGG